MERDELLNSVSKRTQSSPSHENDQGPKDEEEVPEERKQVRIWLSLLGDNFMCPLSYFILFLAISR